MNFERLSGLLDWLLLLGVMVETKESYCIEGDFESYSLGTSMTLGKGLFGRFLGSYTCSYLFVFSIFALVILDMKCSIALMLPSSIFLLGPTFTPPLFINGDSYNLSLSKPKRVG